jgi:hypothetical protein
MPPTTHNSITTAVTTTVGKKRWDRRVAGRSTQAPPSARAPIDDGTEMSDDFKAAL